MINVVFNRTFDDSRGKQLVFNKQQTATEAIGYFIKSEMAFGSNVEVLSDECLVSCSSCLGTTDEIVFTGDAQAMAELMMLAKVYSSNVSKATHGMTPKFCNDPKLQKELSDFMKQCTKGQRSFDNSIRFMITKNASAVNTNHMTSAELVDLYLMLISGEATAAEIEEAFA